MPKKKPDREIFRYALGVPPATVKRRYEGWRRTAGKPITCDNPNCQLHGGPLAWNGATLPWILDHINGVRADNRLRNLRALCPNCNAQLPTHAGGNKGKVRMAPGGFGERRGGLWHYTLPAESGRYGDPSKGPAS